MAVNVLICHFSWCCGWLIIPLCRGRRRIYFPAGVVEARTLLERKQTILKRKVHNTWDVRNAGDSVYCLEVKSLLSFCLFRYTSWSWMPKITAYQQCQDGCRVANKAFSLKVSAERRPMTRVKASNPPDICWDALYLLFGHGLYHCMFSFFKYLGLAAGLARGEKKQTGEEKKPPVVESWETLSLSYTHSLVRQITASPWLK